MENKVSEEKMSRKDFLKLMGAGIAGLAVFTKFGAGTAMAASVTSNSSDGASKVSDNLTNDAIFRSNEPPENTNLLWMYIGTENYKSDLATGTSYLAPGTLCYYENGWKPVTATWA